MKKIVAIADTSPPVMSSQNKATHEMGYLPVTGRVLGWPQSEMD